MDVIRDLQPVEPGNLWWMGNAKTCDGLVRGMASQGGYDGGMTHVWLDLDDGVELWR